MEYVLQAFGLRKRYRNNENALDGLSLNVPKGSIYGLVGQNGAGKTTFFRLVTGLQPPTNVLYSHSGADKAAVRMVTDAEYGSDGFFTLFGADSRTNEIHRARARIGAIVDSPSYYPSMTAVENLKTVALLRRSSEKQIPELLEYVGLADTGKKKAKHFSLGMRQRLGIAMALVGHPDLLILDEPVNGLDPRGIVEIRELILKLNREQNVTVIISSHILSELSRLATHYGFVHKGKLVKELTENELEAQCRKKMMITVTDTDKLPLVLEPRGVGYSILNKTEAEIYDALPVGELAEALKKQGVSLLASKEQDEDLETYFINLIGGAK